MRVHGASHDVGHSLVEEHPEHLRPALDEQVPDAAFLELCDDPRGRDLPVAGNDRRHAVEAGLRPGREDIPLGIPFGEEAQRGREPSGACYRDLRKVGPQPGPAASGAFGFIPQQQCRIVVPQCPGAHEDRVARGAQAHHRVPVFGRGDHQPPGRVVVEVVVGRRGEGEGYAHRFKVKRVISGHAPSRMG